MINNGIDEDDEEVRKQEKRDTKIIPFVLV